MMLRAKTLAIAGFALIGLSGCGADHRELQAWIDEVKARPGGAIEPLPEISPAPSYVYDAAGRRSPFVPDEPRRASSSETGVRPPVDRPREYLEGEPLDALSMVGTLSDPSGAFGLVQDSEGLVHRVRIGNHMGQNYGRITNISESEIQLVEIIADGLGGYYERPASIGLND